MTQSVLRTSKEETKAGKDPYAKSVPPNLSQVSRYILGNYDNGLVKPRKKPTLRTTQTALDFPMEAKK